MSYILALASANIVHLACVCRGQGMGAAHTPTHCGQSDATIGERPPAARMFEPQATAHADKHTVQLISPASETYANSMIAINTLRKQNISPFKDPKL